ncbi:anhydro-N-acetylmuramic acid kinase [Rubellimicrobium aerolatum]|uniref:Anhydro-N-acetylmuramic acid kinase n=1 Tax=Rubellimicrobium aerolatum TaxID=490979 RepID=A0ABW0S5Y1_9RHOB|nr:anhydro-N-acetylmuramic acid kinase [Rubellimicrobium aerolatum]MBP1804485.1 anhydro-N-acetylmuramic acid kinase [Rubellimicrobium aerolatum]
MTEALAAPLTALGAMSGTSLDGVDAAVLVTDGERIAGFGPTAYRPYTPDERATLRAALGHWDGEEVEAAARVVEAAHIEILSRFPAVDLVGFHGQTLAHDPGGRGTLQVGDGAALAKALNRPVIWDFRSEDVRQGGQGAPLAPFFHWALARRIGATEPLAVLNLGGVGNLTWIDPRADCPEAPGALLAFDTGPANAPVDDLLHRRRGLPRDEDGRLAAAGTVSEPLVAAFLSHPFFARPPPKSLDRDAWAHLLAAVESLPDADAAATLTACAAAAVGQGLRLCPAPPARLLVTGGGRRNPTLMAMIAARAACDVAPVESVGLDGDMLEAQAFAFLAVRVRRGLPTSAPGTTGVPRPVTGGRLSRP